MIAIAGTASAANDPVEPGITVLNAAQEGSASVSGQASVHTRKFTVASNHSEAVVVNGRGRIQCADVRIAGGYDLDGNHAQIQGGIWTGYQGASDPLFTQAAALNAMSAQYDEADGDNSNGSIEISNGNHTVEPGYYPGGIQISGGNVTFQPGTYILRNGMKISGQSAIEGEGVTFVILDGDVLLAGGSAMRISPAEEGDLAGFSIAMPESHAGHISLTGNSDLWILGSIYAPSGSMSVTGQAVGTASPFVGEVVVVDTLTLAGRGSILIGAMGPVNIVLEPKND